MSGFEKARSFTNISSTKTQHFAPGAGCQAVFLKLLWMYICFTKKTKYTDHKYGKNRGFYL